MLGIRVYRTVAQGSLFAQMPETAVQGNFGEGGEGGAEVRRNFNRFSKVLKETLGGWIDDFESSGHRARDERIRGTSNSLRGPENKVRTKRFNAGSPYDRFRV